MQVNRTKQAQCYIPADRSHFIQTRKLTHRAKNTQSRLTTRRLFNDADSNSEHFTELLEIEPLHMKSVQSLFTHC
jgi:hypothetical protein